MILLQKMTSSSHYCVICGQIPNDRQDGISYHEYVFLNIIIFSCRQKTAF